MKVTRIAAPLGARIAGIDVRKATEVEWLEINQHFLTHQVIVFPNQNLT